VNNEKGLIREGLTAEMMVPIKSLKAQLIPSYLLSLDDVGSLGIKILENNVVRFIRIEIIEDTLDGIWVAGLPQKSMIITVGQEYVINGQEVNVQIVQN
jgi:multidrug efflux system membrane fusion protein